MAEPEGNGLRLWIAHGRGNNFVFLCVCVCVWLVGTSLQVWSTEPNATVGTGSAVRGLLRRIVVWCVGVRGGLPVAAWAASPFTRWRSSCQVTENVSRLPLRKQTGLWAIYSLHKPLGGGLRRRAKKSLKYSGRNSPPPQKKINQ